MQGYPNQNQGLYHPNQGQQMNYPPQGNPNMQPQQQYPPQVYPNYQQQYPQMNNYPPQGNPNMPPQYPNQMQPQYPPQGNLNMPPQYPNQMQPGMNPNFNNQQMQPGMNPNFNNQQMQPGMNPNFNNQQMQNYPIPQGYIEKYAMKFFQKYDKDGNGQLQANELALLINDFTKKLGVQVSPRDVTFLIYFFDSDKSGTIDFQEFTQMLQMLGGKKMDKNQIKQNKGKSGSFKQIYGLFKGMK